LRRELDANHQLTLTGADGRAYRLARVDVELDGSAPFRRKQQCPLRLRRPGGGERFLPQASHVGAEYLRRVGRRMTRASCASLPELPCPDMDRRALLHQPAVDGGAREWTRHTGFLTMGARGGYASHFSIHGPQGVTS
jgi:hypothetical protein